ncbi:MAG: hypothetical protein DRI86_03730 [Bacteroidetes bacterium]|nr:MAG: hypothetical protein DRI86_03730 [Bacteroidota bacterium]
MKKRKKLFMGATIFSFFTLLSFKFDSTTVTWIWEGDRITPILLVILTVSFGVLWIRENRKVEASN